MKKINYLLLLAIAIIQLSCRTEEFTEKSFTENLTSSKFSTRRVFPNEFQQIESLNRKFQKSEIALQNKLSTGKSILDGAVIDSSYAMESTDGMVMSYTFPVYRKGNFGFFENLVLQKKIGEPNFKSYLYIYERVGTNSYNKNNIQVVNLESFGSNVSGKLLNH
jgi:hypothetical protein